MLQEPCPTSAFRATTEHQARNSQWKPYSSKAAVVFRSLKLVLKTEQIALCRNSVTMEFRTETGFLSAFAHRCVPSHTSGECWESYLCVRCRADDWEQSQMQVADAFSQVPNLPCEPHASTIQVADGSPTVLHRDLLVAPLCAWP